MKTLSPRQGWFQWMQSIGPTHSIHLNPRVPNMPRDSIVPVGEEMARRVRRNLLGRSAAGRSEGPPVIILAAECAEGCNGLWHFHGVVRVANSRQRRELERNALRWFCEVCDYYREKKWRQSSRKAEAPTCEVKPIVPEDIEALVNYALKDWNWQEKIEGMIVR